MFNHLLFALFLAVLFPKVSNFTLFSESQDSEIMKIKKSTDFTVKGDGSNENWSKTDWLEIPQRRFSGDTLTTKVKVLYSNTGIYFLFNCQDIKLTATMNADFMDLWKEDVVEIFLWTDEKSDSYFEYEISPLNYELPILISTRMAIMIRSG